MTEALIQQRVVNTGSSLQQHPVLERIYAARGIESAEQLDRRLNILPSPDRLSGMSALVGYLVDALHRQRSILVVGDFDADGATSCAVAITGLRMLGFDRVSYLVPNRFEFGYGLTPELVEFAVSAGKPDLILTVDSGIACHTGVSRAREQGIDVLVTDHHLPGESLPPAQAIVNPNLPGDSFPSKNLAGVGVMFYVITALRAALRQQGYFSADRQEPNVAELLDFVALGTVADVVALDQVNRALVYQGLARVRRGLAHPGIMALLHAAGRSYASLTASDLGFAIAPRLNAAGRLDDMSLGIECLICPDEGRAAVMAETLDSLNRERREIEEQMKQEALQLIRASKSLGGKHENLPAGLCLFEPGWHVGVIGILASRIKDRHQRPVITFAEDTTDMLKGSARSVPGIHIRDVLCQLDAENPGLIERFGGHAMAAGLSLARQSLPEFTRVFQEMLQPHAELLAGPRTYLTDGLLEDEQLDLRFARELEAAGPWGQAFPEPLFEGVFEVLELRIVGRKHLKFVLRQAGARRSVDAIAFNVETPDSWLDLRQLRAVYKLAINEYRGQQTPQLIIDYFLRHHS